MSPRIERLLLVPLFALPVLWLAGYFFPPINHDVAAILDVSARWVGGEKLYVEVIDENLPLTFIVHAVPVLTAKLLHGSVPFWFTAWVVAGIAASFYSCSRLVKLVPSADNALTEALLPPVPQPASSTGPESESRARARVSSCTARARRPRYHHMRSSTACMRSYSIRSTPPLMIS